MAAGCRAAAAAQDELPVHELAIIFADRALDGVEAGIGAIGAAGPFPDIAEKAGPPEDGRGSIAPARSSWLPPDASCDAAAASHSNSVGKRAPAQVAKASAS